MVERVGDEKVGLGINSVGKFELGRRAGVMVPGDGDADVVESLRLDLHEILFRIPRAPVLSGWCFKIIPQVCTAEKFPGCLIAGCVAARDAGQVGRPDDVRLSEGEANSDKNGEEEGQFCGWVHGMMYRSSAGVVNWSSAKPQAPRSQPHRGDAPSSRLAKTENRCNKRGRIYGTGC